MQGLACDWENHEEDRMTKSICALTAAAIFAVFSAAFAQAPVSEEVPVPMPPPSQEMTTTPAPSPVPSPSMGEEKKPTKPAKGSQAKGKGKAKGHSKKINRKQADR